MVSKKAVEKQLKDLGFKIGGWGRGEIAELSNIILPGEEIFECVNGIYEGGFALLLASDVRVLLVDKKPLNYLTVEDIRFDQINEIDYYHRLLGAHIIITTGPRNLKFLSFNQPRLRKLINHVQHCMAEGKKKESSTREGQHQSLEKINEQLQSYLLAQYKQQQELHEQLREARQGDSRTALPPAPEPIKPSPELADYLYAQGLLKQHQQKVGDNNPNQTYSTPLAHSVSSIIDEPADNPQPVSQPATTDDGHNPLPNIDLYEAGMKEIFGRHATEHAKDGSMSDKLTGIAKAGLHNLHHPLEINPLRIAYSKLPLVLRNRKLGRPTLIPSIYTGRTEPEAGQ
jgi:hypothetical protein